jgi:gibberellin 20-oxidase
VIEGLGINPDDFDVYKRDMQAVLRANYYHRTNSQEQVIGLTPHMDGGFITLLLQDDVAGLEVMKDGEWICVKPERNAICVHFGDMLEVNSSCIIHLHIHIVYLVGNILNLLY